MLLLGCCARRYSKSMRCCVYVACCRTICSGRAYHPCMLATLVSSSYVVLDHPCIFATLSHACHTVSSARGYWTVPSYRWLIISVAYHIACLSYTLATNGCLFVPLLFCRTVRDRGYRPPPCLAARCVVRPIAEVCRARQQKKSKSLISLLTMFQPL